MPQVGGQGLSEGRRGAWLRQHMSQNQFSPFHLINFLTAMKSFVRRRTKTAAECQAEQAEKKGKGAGAKWKTTRGSWGQAQIASFAFARTQDKAQEGTAEAAAEREAGGAEAR